ncbi:MAG: hypothetical protein K2K67_01950, partial [Treponemataceae bacterium]|nr:hypothetical protein [Treponemataceae bacterium]
IFAQITPRACVEARSVTGGPAKARVAAQLAALRACAAAESGSIGRFCVRVAGGSQKTHDFSSTCAPHLPTIRV